MRVMVIRHHDIDDAGFIAAAFRARGAELTVHLVPADGPLPRLDGVDHVIVLGASWQVSRNPVSPGKRNRRGCDMNWTLTDSLDDFLAATEGHLRTEPVLNTVLLTVAEALRQGGRSVYGGDAPIFGWHQSANDASCRPERDCWPARRCAPRPSVWAGTSASSSTRRWTRPS